MDRAELAGMLADQTTACEPARAALLDGGDLAVWDGSVPSQQLTGIYAARLRRARKRGTETLALPSTVGILTRLEAAQVRIGCIFSPDRTWAFMLFLADDAGVVLACTGVRRAEPSPAADGCTADANARPTTSSPSPASPAPSCAGADSQRSGPYDAST